MGGTTSIPTDQSGCLTEQVLLEAMRTSISNGSEEARDMRPEVGEDERRYIEFLENLQSKPDCSGRMQEVLNDVKGLLDSSASVKAILDFIRAVQREKRQEPRPIWHAIGGAFTGMVRKDQERDTYSRLARVESDICSCIQSMDGVRLQECIEMIRTEIEKKLCCESTIVRLMLSVTSALRSSAGRKGDFVEVLTRLFEVFLGFDVNHSRLFGSLVLLICAMELAGEGGDEWRPSSLLVALLRLKADVSIGQICTEAISNIQCNADHSSVVLLQRGFGLRWHSELYDGTVQDHALALTSLPDDAEISVDGNWCHLISRQANLVCSVRLDKDIVTEMNLDALVSLRLPILTFGDMKGRLVIAQKQSGFLHVSYCDPVSKTLSSTQTIQINGKIRSVAIHDNKLSVVISGGKTLMYRVSAADHLVLMRPNRQCETSGESRHVNLPTSYADSVCLVTDLVIKRCDPVLESLVTRLMDSSGQLSWNDLRVCTDERLVSLELSIQVIEVALRDTCLPSFRDSVICMGLNMLTMNVLVACRSDGDKERPEVDTMAKKRFDEVKRIIGVLSSTHLLANERTMECFCRLLAVSIDLYHQDLDVFQSVVSSIATNETLSSACMKGLFTVKGHRVVLYALTPAILLTCEQELEETMVSQLLASAIDQIHGELSLVHKSTASEQAIIGFVKAVMEYGQRHADRLACQRCCALLLKVLIAEGPSQPMASVIPEAVSLMKRMGAVVPRADNFWPVNSQGFCIELSVPGVKTFRLIHDAQNRNEALDQDGCGILYDARDFDGVLLRNLSKSARDAPLRLYRVKDGSIRLWFDDRNQMMSWVRSALCKTERGTMHVMGMMANDLLLRAGCYHIGCLLDSSHELHDESREDDERCAEILKAELFSELSLESLNRVVSNESRKTESTGFEEQNLVDVAKDGLQRVASSYISYMHGKEGNRTINSDHELIDIEVELSVALMRYLHISENAEFFGENLNGQNTMNKCSGEVTTSTLWKTVRTVRNHIIMSRQKLKRRTDSYALEYQKLLRGIRTKIRLLSLVDSMAERTGEICEVGSQTREARLREIRQFIASDVRVSDVKDALLRQKEKAAQQTLQSGWLMRVLSDITIPVGMKGSMLLHELAKVNGDQQGTSITAQRRLCSALIDLTTQGKGDRTTQLIAISYLAKMSRALPIEAAAEILEQLSTRMAQQANTGFCLQIFEVLALWTVRAPYKSIAPVFLELASGNADRLSRHRALLLTTLVLESDASSRVEVHDVLKCLKDMSPRGCVSAIRLLALAMERTEDLEKENFTVQTRETNLCLNLEQFMVFVLRGIGQALSGGGCLFIGTEAIPESHVFVANEMICMMRYLLRTGSSAHGSITRVSHQVLSMCKDIDLENDDLAVITGLFAVLGKEIAPFDNDGWAMYLSKQPPHVERVVFYDSVSDRITGADHSNELDCTNAAFVPSSRVVVNPQDFTLEANESKIVMRIHDWAKRQFDNPTLAKMALLVHFYGFVAVGLQNTSSMKNLMKGPGIAGLLGLAISDTGEKSYRSLPKEMAEIGKGIMNAGKLRSRLKACGSGKAEVDSASPERFLSLSKGNAGPDRIESSSGEPGWFIGDVSLSNTSTCEYEVTVLRIDGHNLRVGFIDSQTEITKGCNFFGFDYQEKSLISPLLSYPCGRCTITNGSVIGCVYKESTVAVTINGVEIGEMPAAMSGVIPTIFSSCKKLCLSYNFKRTPTIKVNAMNEPLTRKSSTETSSSRKRVPRTAEAPTVRFRPLRFAMELTEVLGCPVMIRNGTVPQTGTISSCQANGGKVEINMVSAAEGNVKSQEIKVCDLDVSPARISDIVSYLVHSTDTDKKSTEALYNLDLLRLKGLVRGYCVRMLRYFSCSVIDYYRRSARLRDFLSKPLAVDLIRLLLHEVFETSLILSTGKHEVVPDVHCFFEDGILMFPGDCHSFSQYIRSLCMSNANYVITVLENVSRTALINLTDHCDIMSDVFKSIDRYMRFEFPHPCPMMDLHFAISNADAIGYIPVLAPEHDIASSVVVNQRAVKDICDCCFIPGSSASVTITEPQSERFGVRCGLFVVTRYLCEAMYKTKIGDMHIVSIALSLVQASKEGQMVQRLVDRHLLQLMASNTENHFFASVFCISTITSFPSGLRFGEISEETAPLLESIRQKCSSIGKMEPLPLSHQVHLVVATLGEIAAWNSQVARMAQRVRLVYAKNLYDSLVARKKRLDRGVPDEIIDLLALCMGIGSYRYGSNGFPAHLMIDPWIGYGNPQWHDGAAAQDGQRMYFLEHFLEFCRELDMMSTEWSESHDEQLCWMMQRDESLVTQNPLCSPDVLETFSQFPPRVVYCRIRLLGRLNDGFDSLSLIGGMDESTVIRTMVKPIMNLMPFSRRAQLIRKAVGDKCRGSSSSKLSLRFNREEARKFHELPVDASGKSLLSQFIGQVNGRKPSVELMNQNVLAWSVEFVGERALDYGGPSRDVFTETCMEIMDPSLGLFIPTPNHRNKDGPNQDVLIPNPASLDPTREREYYYAGILIATAFQAAHNIPFRFARFVWTALIDDSPIDIDEIYAVDRGFKRLMDSIEHCHERMQTEKEFESMYPYCFETRGSGGEMVELMANGAKTKVTFARRMEYVQKCKQFRQMEMEPQLAALRAGFKRFVTSSVSDLMRPRDLQFMVCGPEQCPIDRMKQYCVVEGPDSLVRLLWTTLTHFTTEERLLLIKFGCGRMGLPAPGTSDERILTIRIQTSDRRDQDKQLPTAATCGSTIYMSDYSTEHWMALKLRAAIKYANEING